MKWRNLMELATSSSPPNSNRSAAARRRVLFESLENRKLFAADVAEATDVEEVAFDVRSIEEVPLENPEIMMMTFRANAAEDDIALDADASDVEGSPIMYMTGAIGDFEDGQVRTLETDLKDVTVTSELVDGALSDEDLIFYSMGETSDTDASVETTSLEESLAPEDVNGDGSVTALDMLLVINALNSNGFMPSGQLTAQDDSSPVAGNWDINRDGYVTPLDALLLTNFFNNGTSVSTSLAVNGSRIRMPDTDSEEIVADESSQDTFAAPMVDSISATPKQKGAS